MSDPETPATPARGVPLAPPPREALLFPGTMIRAAYLAPVGARLQVLNWEGAPWPDARLWPVEPNGVKPKPVFKDESYTTPHGLFVTADAEGFFPYLHAPEGEGFDLLLTSPEGTPLLRYSTIATDPLEGGAS